MCLLGEEGLCSWWPEDWYPSEPDARGSLYPDLESSEVPLYWDTAEPATVLSIAIIRFYQGNLAQLRTGACPFLPSCSRYGLAAISEYGAFWGWLMTLDRIFYRENEHIYSCYPRVRVGREDKPFDPPRFDYIWGEMPEL